MITCPRCGAENKPEATVCRMCATTLDPAAAMHGAPRPPQPPAQEIPATVLIPSPGAPAGGPTQGGTSGKVTCPGCQAANDADWAFCQQCGTRLASQPGGIRCDDLRKLGIMLTRSFQVVAEDVPQHERIAEAVRQVMEAA